MANARKVEQSRSGQYLERTKRFFRGVWAELKKVVWPSRKELVAYTAVVLVSVAFVALLIWIVDSALSLVLELLIGT
jgi:preprotein translocase subunit SecE